jgi:hypothetical protein
MKTQTIQRGIIIVSMSLTFAMTATAKVYWGVRAGVSRSSIVQKVDLDYRSGWDIGGSVAGLIDIPLYERFSFRPEVALVYQGGSFLSELDETGAYLLKNECKGYAVQVPLNIAFNIPISGVTLAVFGGPAFDFHLYDAVKTKKIDDGTTTTPAPQINTSDFGINVGISVEYKNVFFSINTLSGTTDRRTVKIKNESSVYQNNVTFSLGYFFR